MLVLFLRFYGILVFLRWWSRINLTVQCGIRGTSHHRPLFEMRFVRGLKGLRVAKRLLGSLKSLRVAMHLLFWWKGLRVATHLLIFSKSLRVAKRLLMTGGHYSMCLHHPHTTGSGGHPTFLRDYYLFSAVLVHVYGMHGRSRCGISVRT